MPEIKYVYGIVCTSDIVEIYNAYRSDIESKMKNSKANSPANEQRRWHGTKRACQLGDKGITVLCSFGSCSLCQIIRESFDVSHIMTNTKWGRLVSEFLLMHTGILTIDLNL